MIICALFVRRYSEANGVGETVLIPFRVVLVATRDLYRNLEGCTIQDRA